jgi:ABC-type spermidine/putrescine transport system permease subunit II
MDSQYSRPAGQVGQRVGIVAVLLGLAAAGALSVMVLAAERVLRGLAVLPLGIAILGLAIAGLVLYRRVIKDPRRTIGGFGRVQTLDCGVTLPICKAVWLPSDWTRVPATRNRGAR